MPLICPNFYEIFDKLHFFSHILSMSEEKKPISPLDILLDIACDNTRILTRTNAQVGDLVRIVRMKNGPQYNGKDGTVTKIDRVGFLHGTWGEMPICPSNDEYETILPADINGPIEHLMKK